MHPQLFDLLTANRGNAIYWWKFQSHRIKHPKSGDQIVLVDAPDQNYETIRVAREGLNCISTHA
jgi:hypothetical protein